MVTYGGMSKKPITVSTSSFIFKVSSEFPCNWICDNVAVIEIQKLHFHKIGKFIRNPFEGSWNYRDCPKVWNPSTFKIILHKPLFIPRLLLITFKKIVN
jgi:hypothetical protein